MTVATFLTVIRLLLAPLLVVFLLRKTPSSLWIAFALFTTAALTDYADGYLARKTETVTKAGRILDPLADKLLVAFAFLALLFLGLPSLKGWMVAAILGREVLVTGLRSFVGRRGIVIHSSVLAKWKTGLQMGVIFGLLLMMAIRSVMDPSPSYWTRTGHPTADVVLAVALVVTTVVTILSGLDYLWKSRSALLGAR